MKRMFLLSQSVQLLNVNYYQIKVEVNKKKKRKTTTTTSNSLRSCLSLDKQINGQLIFFFFSQLVRRQFNCSMKMSFQKYTDLLLYMYLLQFIRYFFFVLFSLFFLLRLSQHNFRNAH